MNLFYSRNTVGCKIGEKIYVHPELHTYPELYKAILEHEGKHTKSYKFKDIKMDLMNDELRGHKRDFYKFIFKHPSTLLGFLPISKIDDKWVVDVTMLAFMVFTLLFFGGLFALING